MPGPAAIAPIAPIAGDAGDAAGPHGAGPDDAAAETTAGPPGTMVLLRRYRAPLLLALAVLSVSVLVAVARTGSVRGQLDPRATDAAGSRALAVLLDDRGVTVTRTTRLADLTQDTTERTVLLLPFPDLVPTRVLRSIGDQASARVVLVAPDTQSVAAVTNAVQVGVDEDVETREPNCSDPTATVAGNATLGGQTYRSTTGTVCYGATAGPYVVARTRGGGTLVVLGAGDPLTNDHLDEDGNAALALNLLGADGSSDEVRWLVPSPDSVAASDQVSATDILPRWAGPAVLQLLFAALLAGLWRARRLGPPVTEPLPVVVRAAEAVEGRARLYRRAQARGRAADALRSGALATMVPRLNLDLAAGGEPAPQAVVAVVCARSGLPGGEVGEALYGAAPADDAALVKLADTLDSIVRSTLDPEVGHP